MKIFDRYFEQCEIGDTWISSGRTITEADIVMFSAFSGDWYPLHSNKEYAERTSFGQRIAHGMLVLSVSTGLMDFKPGIVVAFYGMDYVRFVNPTFIGDTLRLESELIGKQEKNDETGILTVKQVLRKQTGEEVAVFNMKMLIAKEEGYL